MKKHVEYAHLVLAALALFTASCTTPPRGTSEPTSFANKSAAVSKGPVSQAELQDDLLRFESQFNARIQNANADLEASPDPKIRYRATLNRLIYSSNSLDIALGPSPESNLLDMVTFIELSRDVLLKHWIPAVFGPEGKALEQAFNTSRQQIWDVASKVLNDQRKAILRSTISAWHNKHPEQINVETVRLSAFSTEAGAKAEGLDQDVGGLFASVQQSTKAVDAARLFAERALYYAERAPFLLRLQARLGAHEILDDTAVSMTQLGGQPLRSSTAHNLLKELQQTLLIGRTTLSDANSTLKSLSTLIGQLSAHPQTTTSATATITQLTALLKEWNRVQSAAPGSSSVAQMPGIVNQVDQSGRQFLTRAAWLGGALICLFWVLFIISKLLYRYLSLRLLGSATQTRSEHRRNKAA